LISGEQVLSYSEVERRAGLAAAKVARYARGEIIGLLLPNTPEFVWTLLGALWAGKTVAVLPIVAPPALLELMAAEAGLESVLTTAGLAPRLAAAKVTPLVLEPQPVPESRELPLSSRAHDAAVLLYTSGTTGRPKAVALSDQNILANAEGCRQAAGFRSDEVMLAILPLFHAYGLTVTLTLPLILGGTVVLQERFVPRSVLQAIERHRVTCLVAVPSQYRLLAKEPATADTASLWMCIAGAERLSELAAREFEARFHQPVLQGYGVTEAAPVISMNPPHTNRAGTVGRPLPNLHLSVREETSEVQRGEIGEICVAGPNVMLGYHNRPEATAEKLVNGVLRTGDLGLLDADGYLRLAGRADDLIKVAGEKVYPGEVEQAIEQIDGVEEVAVLGARDETHGSVLWAFVQPKPGTAITEASLRAACSKLLQAAKVPRSFVLLEQLPRTPSGKLDKRALQTQSPSRFARGASQ
jgi:long-chain acyl-CoA synthetase